MATKKAGTVLINKEKAQIALVYRKRLGDLSFPKGHLEEGETLEECAIRETIEEVGRNCHLVSNEPIGVIKYKTKDNEEVWNYMFIAEDDGKFIGESVDPEVCVWVDYENVYDALSYDNLKDFYRDVYSKLEEYL